MKMPSTMGGHQFSKVPRADIQRSQFNRSHGHKTTFDAGLLIPIYVDEALPGDTFNLRMSAFVRLATPLKPIMDNLWLDTFFFAVPMRLLWENWERFNGAQDFPASSTSYVIPQQTVPTAGYVSAVLQDYFGLPVGVAAGSPVWSHSCLPTRAYYMVYNEWFRDQNLINSKNGVGAGGSTINLGDGPDVAPVGGCPVLPRGKRHDYFTSCLPWPQKGDAVELPLGTSAPVVKQGSFIPTFRGANTPASFHMEFAAAGTSGNVNFDGTGGPTVANESMQWEDPKLEADLSAATAATINSLREAFQIQKLLERDARGGTRYTEIIKSHFGVTSPDARLQRPEYLGGGTVPIIVSPIAQNSQTDAALEGGGSPTPMGTLAAIGTGSVQGHGFVKSFTEHCVLLGIVCARADLTYSQGVERFWSRSTRYDFYWPAFAGLGEQEVLNKEIYVQGAAADANAFGYQERYAEYRYKPSRITGLFRSGVGGTLDIWHVSQQFGALPTLGEAFINEDVPISRVVAVPSEPEFLFDSYFQLTCARPMPTYGVPGLIDHF